MKSLATLHASVLRNVAQHCSVDASLDILTMSRRTEDEGDSFLTITLPAFAKALERGLRDGFWPAQDMRPTWKHVRGLPAFMRGFLSGVFLEDGQLRSDPDPERIWAVRQVCYLTHKVERDCTPERVQRAFDSYLSCEEDLKLLKFDESLLERLTRQFDRLFGEVLWECDRKIASFDLVPKHGPGAVAERLSPLDKRRYDYWTDRLESVFPRWRYASNLPIWKIDHALPIESELPVRVITVPKTQSTPRIIAIEPSTVQYAQQGLKRELYELIERGSLGKILGFTDQSRNREMARIASVTQAFSTLDLSEASDRVSWSLVSSLLKRYTHVYDFIEATRSRTAELPSGVVTLEKFASMGSALTFPIEAMVFTAIAAMGMQDAENRPIPASKLVGNLSVYGDDIIIPVGSTASVIGYLEHFGAKVNRSKSFWSGNFRESCGAEFFDGTDVSVVRLRADLPRSRSDAAELASLVDFRNRCYFAGLWSVVGEIDSRLETLISLPYARAHSPNALPRYLAKASCFEPYHVKVRWNTSLHIREAKYPTLVPQSKDYVLDGEAGLLEWFHDALRRDDLVDRFASQERATAFSIYSRWHQVL